MSKPVTGRHGGTLKLHRRPTFGEVSLSPLSQKPEQIPLSSIDGEVVPLKYLRLGGAAHSPGRGGARNRKHRETFGLRADQVANLRSAALFADDIGLPLNRMITIHWEAASVPLAEMTSATGRFIDLLSKALARHGSRTAWVWTHENGTGKGAHLHLLVHVPPTIVRVVTGLQKGWLRRITGRPYRARVIYSTPIGPRLGIEASNPDVHAVNRDAALAYTLKGATGTEGAEGRILGKRCATSQNLGPKARQTWRERNDA